MTFRWLLSPIHSEAHTLAELLRCQDMCSNSVLCLGKLLWPSVAKITPVLVLWDADE